MRTRGARRTALILALLGVLTPVTRAAAHSCSSPTQAEVGKPFTLNLGVPAEQSAVVGVEVTVPDGFRLDQAEPGPGWTSEPDGTQVRFSGGKVTPYGCTYFILRGTVTERGKLKFPVVTRNEDGSNTEYRGDTIGDPYGAQFVFAGVEPKNSDYFGAEDRGRDSGSFLAVVVALSSLGLLGGAALLARSRNRQAEARAAAARRRAPVRTVRRTGRRR